MTLGAVGHGGTGARLADGQRFVERAPGDGAAIAAGHAAVGVVAVAGGFGAHAARRDLTHCVQAVARPALAAVLVGAHPCLGEDVAQGVIGQAGGLQLAVAKIGAGAGQAVEAVVAEGFAETLDAVAARRQVADLVEGEGQVLAVAGHACLHALQVARLRLVHPRAGEVVAVGFAGDVAARVHGRGA